MPIIIIIIIVAVLFFIMNGFKVRCPNCGVVSFSHNKVNNAGYTDAFFRCNSCSHEFSREVCADWFERHNEVGKEQSIKEYRESLDK